MQRIIGSLIIFLAIVFTSCGEDVPSTPDQPLTQNSSDKESRKQELRDLKAELSDGEILDSDSLLSQELLDKSVAFVNDFPDDSSAATILLVGVGSASGLEQYQMSLTLLDRIIARYPDYKRMDHVYYLRAYILDYNFKSRKTEAEAAYRQLLTKFPNYEHAEEIKGRIEYMNMSELEVIREFEKKNLGDSSLQAGE